MYEEKKTDPSGNVYEVEEVREGGKKEGVIRRERGIEREAGRERERERERERLKLLSMTCIFRRKRTCIARSTTTVRQ